jgi:ABC-type uncharacterized transport system permease subunit
MYDQLIIILAVFIIIAAAMVGGLYFLPGWLGRPRESSGVLSSILRAAVILHIFNRD